MIPNVINIIKLVTINPTTSGTTERTFLFLRCYQQDLGLLDSLALLKIRKEGRDNLNLLNVVNVFVSKKARLSLFVPFTDNDF